MMLICATLNDRLVPRYGDDLYISFIDPVPEDKAFNIQEMQAIGNQPVMAANEARDPYAGLGPVEGGDTLMKPTAMGPIGHTQGTGDSAPQPENAKATVRKTFTGRLKTASGERIAFKPLRTKFKKLATRRSELAKDLSQKIKAGLKKRLDFPSKNFDTTKAQDEAKWKEFGDYVHAAEKDIADAMRKINGDQKQEVLQNLPSSSNVWYSVEFSKNTKPPAQHEQSSANPLGVACVVPVAFPD
jgi:hypothetical protein